MWFDNWESLIRIVVVTIVAYGALVFLLLISGKRTLSKMNAFDFVITVAIGSTLAAVILDEQIALAEGVLALAMLVGLQFVITWLSARSSLVSSLVKAEPRLLFYRNEFLRDEMRRQRITQSEILQAMREQGIASDEQVEAVVLETNGTLSIVQHSEGHSPTALSDVPHA